MDRNKSFWAWLSTCPAITDYITFNAVEEMAGETGIQTISNASWVERYVRGGGVQNVDFAVVQIKPHDMGTSDVNFLQFFDAESVMNWVKAQNRIRNFPDFGENMQVMRIEPLENMPNLAAVSEDGGTAKYMFQVRVRVSVKE